MVHRTNEAYFRDLESSAHLPEVQELIREEIQNGTIRVRPKPGGGIQILPVGMPEIEEPIELETPPAPSQDETSPSIRVARKGRRVPQ
jgi:hypothetical protein